MGGTFNSRICVIILVPLSSTRAQVLLEKNKTKLINRFLHKRIFLFYDDNVNHLRFYRSKAYDIVERRVKLNNNVVLSQNPHCFC